MSTICELCGEPIAAEAGIIRVVVDAGVHDGGGGSKITSETVLSSFHKICVAETYAERSCDVVPYIKEAREAIDFDGAD